jgi:hypothetical protein
VSTPQLPARRWRNHPKQLSRNFREKKIGELTATKNTNQSAKARQESLSLTCNIMVAASKDEITTKRAETILELSIPHLSSESEIYTFITGGVKQGFQLVAS